MTKYCSHLNGVIETVRNGADCSRQGATHYYPIRQSGGKERFLGRSYLSQMNITIEDIFKGTENGYLYRTDAKFVSKYAATSPEEDYAETLTTFLLDP